MKEWRKSSRWRDAWRAAMDSERWKHVAMLEDLANGFDPFDKEGRFRRLANAESVRLSCSVLAAFGAVREHRH
jgi:hypothetical protein